jgi:hypothetical protein
MYYVQNIFGSIVLVAWRMFWNPCKFICASTFVVPLNVKGHALKASEERAE